jgi:medium-chain acyl-[acyl-carrier-protein] hydrolase
MLFKMNISTNPWFKCFKPNAKATLRLFCFPYAGGGTTLYQTWPRLLPENVELYVTQLPGRGSRIKEKSLTNARSLVDEIAQAIEPHLDKPFAFFGHSMGTILSFELAHTLRQERGVEPNHLFISGRRAPQFKILDTTVYNLPEPEFIQELRRLNGTPKEVLEHSELMNLMIPILRADFEVCQTYVYNQRQPLGCPMTVFGGLQDADVKREHLEAWQDYTNASFSLKMLPGDHFFLHSSETSLLKQISAELEQVSALLTKTRELIR